MACAKECLFDRVANALQKSGMKEMEPDNVVAMAFDNDLSAVS